jgi:hypothetical protein
MYGQSFTPFRSTDWFPMGTPALASLSHAALDSGVISFGWLKWVFSQTGGYFSRMRQSLSVMRCGMTTGVRVPKRTISRCGMLEASDRSHSIVSSSTVKGSPPVKRRSLKVGVFRM